MRNPILLCLVAVLTVTVVAPRLALAGATITINEDSKIDLGFRLQSQFISSEKDRDGDGDFERTNDFKVRRGRIRLGADVTRWVSMFLQTEFTQDDGTGADMRVIDAFVVLKPHELAQIYVGENMAPASRQSLTSSGGLLAIDRPGMQYKVLTWGTRALTAFANNTFGDADAGLRGDVDVRDLGATLFGRTSLADLVHLKYYLGVYNGVQEAGEDNERFAGRVQLNFFDPESGYYNLSTYLGKKKTVGIGASFDTQQEVALDLATGEKADYTFYTFDLFADYPVGPGTVTFETGYENLDLDDATALDATGSGDIAKARNAKQSQGDGFYAQTGYFIHNWQPWAEYERWESDAGDDKGSYDLWRLGLSYFIKGHNANIKAGYEHFEADENIGSSSEDTIDSFVVGLYVTY